MGDFENNGLFEAIHPKLRPYVKALLNHEFGLLGTQANIESVESGSIVAKNDYETGDRFVLRMHYCKKSLFWQVIMNANNLTCPPDFIMEDNFLNRIDSQVIKHKVPSLANWCPTNVKCLLNVILELLDLHKEYQICIIRSPALSRYGFEYETLTSMLKTPASDVEVCVHNNNRPVTVVFIIRLNVDFSSLPVIVPDNKNLAVLMIDFKDNARNLIQLFPRHELEDTLGGPIEIPDLPSEMSLMDYVPMVQEVLQKRVDDISSGVSRRQILYSYLIQYFEPALLNADHLTFQQVSFLVESNGFYCVLKIDIPLEFPNERPRITLLSLKKSKAGTPRSEEFNNWNYNRNWAGSLLAEKMYAYVKTHAIVKFKENVTFG